MFKPDDLARLETARNLWLATVRPDGSPHLVPIWFVWLDDRAYLCTSRQSVKARNLSQNDRFALALEDGDDPLVLQGYAEILDAPPPEVARAFKHKFGWDISGDTMYNAVIRLTPTRVVL